MQWLRNNKDQFKGEVYEPFIVSGNVINQKFAVYIENSIALKDLTIFFFENGDDMNTFLHQARNVMNLERVGAAQVPQEGADTFTARVAAKTLKPLGLVSYLKEMVQAPSPVLAYMCQQVIVSYNKELNRVGTDCTLSVNGLICLCPLEALYPSP